MPFDLQGFVKGLTGRPGVYRMIDANDVIIYVGKASNLKRRVSSYFNRNHDSAKTTAMVAKIVRIQVAVTHSEAEALILENDLIKQHRPRYNVLLKDDKGYPYIFLSAHPFPRLDFHRGSRKKKGEFFGPYPNVGAVRENLSLLQKIFPVRQCSDSFYRNRSRACLQHEIGRCTAPCVDKIAAEEYQQDVDLVRLFLQGKNQSVINKLVAKMELAAAEFAYEKAAGLRDQIQVLRKLQEQQHISGGSGDMDVIAAATRPGGACVHVLFVRNGQLQGNRAYFPECPTDTSVDELLEAFIAQFYLNPEHKPPTEILLPQALQQQEVLQAFLSDQTDRKVRLRDSVRGDRSRWQKLSQTNADQALDNRLGRKANQAQRMHALKEQMHLPKMPRRMECFDISHSHGEATVASCVVFIEGVPAKAEYRKFNITGITGGDDYAAMRQAIHRRYSRVKAGDGILPDLLLIDGGKGQMTQAVEVLSELELTDLPLLGVAKGVSRKPGLEALLRSPIDIGVNLPSDSPALHLIQHIRDESHRFAITNHRKIRDKKRSQSKLEGIEGVGPAKRKELIGRFGSVRGISGASIEELEKVSGISNALAERIYHALH
ncbi:excinuclease ABC subunit C [Pelagibaculum spongiae]|uniref:UvrABC system protein C n=2 Tax=Pelagibaculum spongiae TaxID=2080658 RepID=A0A2V1H2C1_9GAMM|nr:excinuclease ABC subunit UvrC [Pelagibaculum spongiae]PVZ69056.1 excinuclease ABC subunit C [Pelagibaculum spongiae]